MTPTDAELAEGRNAREAESHRRAISAQLDRLLVLIRQCDDSYELYCLRFGLQSLIQDMERRPFLAWRSGRDRG